MAARHPFYEVSKDACLFRSETIEGTPGPEEAVRQWCAFELIRAYGFLVTNLRFEWPVKVGSKKYRIDIVVLRNNTPWIVVECKEPGHDKHSHGMEQALSYANAREIQAEFAVYTNGSAWRVERKIQGNWIAIPDLPTGEQEPAESIIEVLGAIYETAPILYKLDEAIEGQDAETFLCCLQRFFFGRNLLTTNVARELLDATDNLLRILSTTSDHPQHFRYEYEKLSAAAQSWERYRSQSGVGDPIQPLREGGFFSAEIGWLESALRSIIRGAPKSGSTNILLLRLDVALLDYAEDVFRSKKHFLQVPGPVHEALRDFLNQVFTEHLGRKLPDRIDTHSISEMKSSCRPYWNDVQRKPASTPAGTG